MNRLSANSLWITLEKAAHLLGGLTLMVLVARSQGEAGLGEYVFVIGLTALFVPLLDLGLNQRVIKLVGADGPQSRQVTSEALGFKVLAGGPAVAVMGLGAWFLGASGKVLTAVLLVGGSTVVMSLADAFNALFKGLERPQYSAVLMIFLNGLLVAGAFFAVQLGMGLRGVAAAYLGSRTIYLGVASYLAWRRFPDRLARVRPRAERPLIVDGLKHFPSVYFLGSLLHLNMITTFYLAGDSVAGLFAVGYRLAAALFVLVGACLEAILPALSGDVRQGGPLLGRIRRSSWAIGFLSIGSVLLVSQLADRAVTIVFGAEFAEAVEPVRILAWTVVPFSLCGLGHTALLAMNREGGACLAMGGLVVSGAGLGVALFPLWGAPGTAWSPTAVATGFSAILLGAAWRSARRIGRTGFEGRNAI